jgi:hypothetical protein
MAVVAGKTATTPSPSCQVELMGLVRTYQTPSMVDMVHRSQALQPEVPKALN